MDPHIWPSIISDVLLWTPTYGRAKAGRPARTCIQQLCEDTGCSPEDLLEAMNNREKWRERIRDIHASGTTWWWWWWWKHSKDDKRMKELKEKNVRLWSPSATLGVGCVRHLLKYYWQMTGHRSWLSKQTRAFVDWLGEDTRYLRDTMVGWLGLMAYQHL